MRVAELVAEYIKASGYTVITCFSGTEALNIIERRVSAVSIVVLDVVMPDIDGFAVAKKMKSFFGKDNLLPHNNADGPFGHQRQGCGASICRRYYFKTIFPRGAAQRGLIRCCASAVCKTNFSCQKADTSSCTAITPYMTPRLRQRSAQASRRLRHCLGSGRAHDVHEVDSGARAVPLLPVAQPFRTSTVRLT